VAVAAVCGAVFGLLHAFLTVGLALSQHVSGLGITLLATSLSSYGYRVSFPKVNTPPTVQPFAADGLAGHPHPVGADAAHAAGLAAGARHRLAAVPHAHRPGLRMVGENPQAAESQGVSVLALRTGAIVAGSA
jgi:ABC-type uncharacterized transport system permease subunit